MIAGMDAFDLGDFGRAVVALRQRLAAPLPGRETMLAIAPSRRGFVPEEEARARAGRLGGALVLVYPIAGRPHTVLTLRSASLRHHAGQVSFPGGRQDPGESLAQAALREAWEELAIPAAALECLGDLTPIYIPPSDYLLFPTVAATAGRPEFRPQPSEVAAIIEAPLDHFVGPANRRVETWLLRGERRRVPHFVVGEHKVWGATAMILGELAQVWDEARRPALAHCRPA